MLFADLGKKFDGRDVTKERRGQLSRGKMRSYSADDVDSHVTGSGRMLGNTDQLIGPDHGLAYPSIINSNPGAMRASHGLSHNNMRPRKPSVLNEGRFVPIVIWMETRRTCDQDEDQHQQEFSFPARKCSKHLHIDGSFFLEPIRLW